MRKVPPKAQCAVADWRRETNSGTVFKRLLRALHRLPEKSRLLIFTVVFALGAALVAVAFQVAINYLYAACFVWLPAWAPRWFPWISLLVIGGGALFTGWLVTQNFPEAAGSGIPQLKLAFWKDFGAMPARLGWVKFLAGVLSIGTGQSLGREGPSVQLGGSIASTLAGTLGIAKQGRRGPAAAGAAAGLAAAFNAPLAAVAFVLEEILEDLHSRLLGAVLLASVVGAIVVHALLGAQPAFNLPRIDEPTWRAYVLMPVAAAFAALAGVVFQRWSLRLRAAARGWRMRPLWRPVIGALLTWALGMSVYHYTGHLGVFGLGYDDLSATLEHGSVLSLALALLVAKLIATTACYGLGGCGGVFSPSLFFGAMAGAAVAALGGQGLSLGDADRTMLVVGGMSACLGGVVQAPVTAVLIIFEMTHQFSLLPGLMIAGLVSQLVARRFNHHNFYEEILIQDGHQMAHVIPPRDFREWHRLPVGAISFFTPVTITHLAEEAVAAVLATHPYARFPVVVEGALQGVLLRTEFARARAEGRPMRLVPPARVTPDRPISECQSLLMDSECGLLILTDGTAHGLPLGVITLHDLLRAQTALGDREG